jgi:Asp-tRNA(Asn)/Glu-tRNA(Gln) amidotransferase A subunit family amidase
MLVQMIERGKTYSDADYRRAVEGAAILGRELARVLSEYDAILTPATPGEAPLGLASTGSPMFCTTWTLCGVPALNMPILEGAHRMPIGAQLVGPRDGDGRLLAIARVLEQRARADAAQAAA